LSWLVTCISVCLFWPSVGPGSLATCLSVRHSSPPFRKHRTTRESTTFGAGMISPTSNPTIVGRTALHRTGSIFTFVFHLSFFPHPYHEPKVFQRLSIVCLFLGEEGKKKKGVLNFVLLDSIILEIPLLLGRIAYIQYIHTYICVLLLAL